MKYLFKIRLAVISITCVILVLIISLSSSCRERRYTQEATEITSKLDIDQKIGQLIMIALPGKSIGINSSSLIRQYKPGGVVLFGYNCSDFKGTRKFIEDIQAESIKSSLPMFVSIDQEGGRVRRITDGVTQFPGNMAAGVADDPELVNQWARIIGLELRLIGVNMNLAPAVDVNNNPSNPVINIRSFGSDKDIVAKMGEAYIMGLQESRCMAVAKHFPGHGDTDLDSHKTLPVIRYGMDRLENVELVPFNRAIHAGVECIMSAHISYPEINKSGDPATVSGFFLSDLLRTKMKFRGIVITDDMEMHAIARRQAIGEAALRSVLAGADIVLLSSWEGSVPAIISSLKIALNDGRLSMARIDESVVRIIEAKLRYGVISFGEDKIVRAGSFSISEAEKNLLQKGVRVNREISRKAVSHTGTMPESAKLPNVRKIIISRDRNFGMTGVRATVFPDFASFYGKMSIKLGSPVVVFYHVNERNIDSIKNISKECARRKLDLVLVSTGNPFPIAMSNPPVPVLYSYSDTPESIRQLRLCIEAAFLPKTAINLKLSGK